MTDRYNLPKKGDPDWHLPLNRNFAALEDDVELRDLEANRGEHEPYEDRKFLATDTGAIYVGNGSSWQQIESTGTDPTFDTAEIGSASLESGSVTVNPSERTDIPNKEYVDSAVSKNALRNNEYVVYEENETVHGYGPNGLVASDTDAATVLNAISDEMSTLGGDPADLRRVCVHGNLSVSHTVELKGSTKYEFYGRISLDEWTDEDLFRVGESYTWIDGLRCDGRSPSNDGGSAINVDGGNNFWLTNSWCWRFSDNGIHEEGSTSTGWVHNCAFTQCSTGISLGSGADWILSNNQVGNCRGDGVSMTGGYNTLTNCQIFLSGGCGLALGGQCQTVSNCRINHNGRAGIEHWRLNNSTVTNIDLLRNGQSHGGDDEQVGVSDLGGAVDCIFTNLNGNNQMPEGDRTQKYTVFASAEYSDYNIYDNITGRDNLEGAVAGELGENSIMGNVIGADHST